MSGLYPREVIDRVREAVDIVELISSYITLKKSGANYTALCPFHTEKSPSFSVSQTKQIYHCFGCGEGGNAISFLMKYENLPFPDALERLADRVGIALPKQGKGEDYAVLYDINRAAADFYRKQLQSAPAAVAGYVKKRALSPQTLEKFMLGYAPDAWDGCSNYLVGKKFRPQDIEKAGLTKISSSGNPIDRFRHRLIFPILDEHGKVVGFGGRALADDEKGPKYLNSPETPVYAKSRVIYGLNWALPKIRSENRVLIVEGYIDLIALHQAGVENAVATSGTAFTDSQCKTLKRYTPNLVMIFDGDEAGRKAAARATEVAAAQQVRPSVAMLPAGMDPDELVKSGGAPAFLNIVKEARPYVSYLIEQACRKFDVATPEGRADAARSMLPELAKVRDPIERSSYIALLAEKTAIPAGKIEDRLNATTPRHPAKKSLPASQVPSVRKIKSASPAEKWAMRIVLDHPDLVVGKLKEVSPADFRTPSYQAMYAHIVEKTAAGVLTAGELIESVEDLQLRGAMRSLVMEPGIYDEENRDRLVDDFLKSLFVRTKRDTVGRAKSAAEKGTRDEFLREEEQLKKMR